MNCLYVQWRGEEAASPQTFDTDREAQLALDRLLSEHGRTDEIISIRVLDGHLQWEVNDREGLLCTYWLADGFHHEEQSYRQLRPSL
jgi:hypothetical protein